jgi:hypothetical protein
MRDGRDNAIRDLCRGVEGKTEMKRELTLAVCGFALLVALECPVLLAQIEEPKPVSKAYELSIQTCDSLKNPALGESLIDAANRRKAWWHCLEKGGGVGERFAKGASPPVNMDNGRPVAGTVSSFEDSQSHPVARTDTYVPNSGPNSPPYTFTIGSGPWSKVISVSQVLRESHRLLSTLGLTRKPPQMPIQ